MGIMPKSHWRQMHRQGGTFDKCGGMRVIFDNGVTRARSLAWVQWLAVVATGVGLVAGAPSSASWLCLLTVMVLAGRLILVRHWPRKIPVLNYHSVSQDPEWLQIAEQVSITPAAFESQLAYLERNRYRSLFISEVNEILAGTKRLRKGDKVVALTFDDGYADNWIAALPLLQQYGMKATLFVSTGFIGDADGCRPTLETIAKTRRGELDWSGYLTWPELRAMQVSGIVEIQAHGSAHTQVFAGPGLCGFVGPGKPNRWLLWNTWPETRSHWWRELAKDRSLWGHPVFRQAPALAHRAWRPDPEAVAHLLSRARSGGRAFFASRLDWEQRLLAEWRRDIREHGDHGTWESQSAYERRVEDDLSESKKILESELGVKVDVLCWPENAFSEVGEQVARRVGFTVTVSNRHRSRNAVGEAPDRIMRVFIGSHALGFHSPLWDFMSFVLELKVFEGWYVAYPLLFVFHRVKRLTRAVKRNASLFSVWRRRVSRNGGSGRAI